MSNLSSVPQALDAFRAGKFVIVVDDEQRENEGDLIMAAEHMTTEKMAFMVRYTGGVVCLSLSNDIADALQLPPMVEHNTSKRHTPYTVSIDAAEGITTGISAADRAHTVKLAADPAARADQFGRPGHIFPLRAKDGGVLVRAGHTEAAIDLCRLAGLRTAGVVSELMHDDGSMMRMPSIRTFAADHDLIILSIADLIAWRRQHETLVRMEAESDLETETGLWKIRIYHDSLHLREHAALIKGKISPTTPTLIRVHSECLTGDVFHSRHCDCGQQLARAMQMIDEAGSGVVLYLRQEGRGIGLANKIRAYELQQKEGLDTAQANQKLGFDVDLREYGIGAQILKDVGIGTFRLLTNNPKKIVGLEGYGLEMIEQMPIEIEPTSDQQRSYLQAKKIKMGHLFKNL